MLMLLLLLMILFHAVVVVDFVYAVVVVDVVVVVVVVVVAFVQEARQTGSKQSRKGKRLFDVGERMTGRQKKKKQLLNV